MNAMARHVSATSRLVPTPLAALLAVVAGTVLASPAFTEDAYMLTVKDHAFTPTTLEIPTGKRVKITVRNADQTPEEFESQDLHIEKMMAGNGTISVFVGPLDPGSYGFVGEQHEDTARGTIIVR